MHVAPTLLFTVTSFSVMPINSLAIPRPSLSVYQCTKCDTRNSYKQNFTIVSVPLHSVWSGPTFLSVGIVNISFQSTGTGKYAKPTEHLNFHFKPLVVSYKLSHSEIKDDWISCRLNLTVHSSNSFWPIPHGLLPEKELLKWLFCSFLLRGSWNMLPYTAYVTVLSELENCSKHLAE